MLFGQIHRVRSPDYTTKLFELWIKFLSDEPRNVTSGEVDFANEVIHSLDPTAASDSGCHVNGVISTSPVSFRSRCAALAVIKLGNLTVS